MRWGLQILRKGYFRGSVQMTDIREKIKQIVVRLFNVGGSATEDHGVNPVYNRKVQDMYHGSTIRVKGAWGGLPTGSVSE